MQPNRISDRWIAFLMWLALLIALLVTSGHAASAGIGSGWVSYFPISVNGGSVYTVPVSQLVAILILLSLLIFFMIRAWLKFSTLTIQLLIAYSKYSADDTELSLLSRFLTLSPVNSTNSSSYLSEILRPLGYIWVIATLMPYVGVIRMFAS